MPTLIGGSGMSRMGFLLGVRSIAEALAGAAAYALLLAAVFNWREERRAPAGSVSG